MRVAVPAAGQIGTSTKTAAGIAHYANRRKCLTDTMIVYARTGMIAVPRAVEKMRLVLTARLVARRLKCVKTRCLPFVAPTAKHASTEAVAQRRMRMRRNVVPTVSELTAPVAQPTQQPVPTVRLLIQTGVQSAKRDAPETNRFLVNPVPIPGVAQKEILVEQTKENVFWRQFFVIMTVHVLKVMR